MGLEEYDRCLLDKIKFFSIIRKEVKKMESNTVINNSVPVNNRDSSMVANKQPSIKKIFGGKWLAGLIGLVLILLVGGFLVKNFFLIS